MKLKRKTDLHLTSMNRTAYSLALSSLFSSVWPFLFLSCSFFPSVMKVFMLYSKQRKFFYISNMLTFCAARIKQSLNLGGCSLSGCFPVLKFNSSFFCLITLFLCPLLLAELEFSALLF